MADSRNKKMIFVAVGCLVIAGAILGYNFSGGSPSQDGYQPDEKLWMKCTNPQCEATFQITEKEYFEFLQESSGGMGPGVGSVPPYPCPECGKDSAYEAYKCPECDLIYRKGSAGPNAYPDECPKCGYSEIKERFEKNKN